MKRILLVEDHVAFRKCLRGLLVEWGYAVEAAASCREALPQARGAGFSLYLIDQGLPDGSGIDLCRQIRALDPSTPVVIYSSAEGLENSALSAGAHAFVFKGGDLAEQLRQELRRLTESEGVSPDEHQDLLRGKQKTGKAPAQPNPKERPSKPARSHN